MRTTLLALVFATSLPVLAADSPPKRGGGLFGFGGTQEDQISAGLFPDSGNSPFSRGTNAAPPSSDGIFKGGQPQKVEPVSYVIDNGRRVERPVAPSAAKPEPNATALVPLSAPLQTPVAVPAPPVGPVAAPVEKSEGGDKKRGGWFGFGKRGDSENPIVTPVPAAAPLLSAIPVATAPVAPAPKPAPAPSISKPVEAPQPAPVAAPTDETPSFAGTKEEKSGWLPFFNRKKHEAPEPLTGEMPAAAPLPAETVAASPVQKLAPVAVPAPGTPAAAEKPAGKPASPDVATFEIRRDASQAETSDKKEKADREGGLGNPIQKIRPPKKEIDLTGAETIIQNGEIVGEDGKTYAAVPESAPSGPRQAPQVVNGVKTYSSWDDVNARSSSAADKIIDRIR